MWFDPSKILSYNRMLNIVLGNRGGGKTFNTLEFCIRRFLKTGKQFIYLRRYDTELLAVKDSLFDAVKHVGHFPNVEFKIVGSDLFINQKLAGFALCLSKSRQLKSRAFPDVDFIIFDEFLIDKGRSTYLNREVNILLDLIETVGRMEDIRIMMLANAITVSNPYFDFFHITPNRYSEFTKHPTKPVIVQFFKDADFIEAKEKTQFGQLISGTSYAEYAIHNVFVQDSYEFIEPMRGKGNYLFTFAYEGNIYGVYFLINQGIYHVNRNINESCPIKFAFTTEDHQPNYILFKSAKSHPFIIRLKYAYDIGKARFDSISTKNACYSLFQYL